jgi:ArsR family transcriptional regulator
MQAGSTAMKDPIPEEVLVRMAASFRILADPSRLAILISLKNGCEMSVGEFVAVTGRRQTNVSKHLKVMATGGILARRKNGLQVFYRLDDPVWTQVCRLVCQFLLNGDTK